jgi:hypothetical protein
MNKWLAALKNEDAADYELTKPTKLKKETLVSLVSSESEETKNKLLSLGEESKIRAWMEHIGETNELLINEYLEKCQIDPGAKQYFLKRSEEVHVSNPEKVMCRYCQHFKVDEIGDGSGIGDCIINATASKNRLMWLNSERYCEQYKYNLSDKAH